MPSAGWTAVSAATRVGRSPSTPSGQRWRRSWIQWEVSEMQAAVAECHQAQRAGAMSAFDTARIAGHWCQTQGAKQHALAVAAVAAVAAEEPSAACSLDSGVADGPVKTSRVSAATTAALAAGQRGRGACLGLAAACVRSGTGDLGRRSQQQAGGAAEAAAVDRRHTSGEQRGRGAAGAAAGEAASSRPSAETPFRTKQNPFPALCPPFSSA
jgi:hypothetical protein